MSQAKQRFDSYCVPSDAYQQVQGQVADVEHKTRNMVQQHPASLFMMMFGLGFGVGLGLVACIPRRHRAWYNKYLPDWIPRGRLARVAEKYQR